MRLLIFTVLLCILSSHGSVISKDGKQIGDKEAEPTIDGINDLIKTLNKDLATLKNDGIEGSEKDKIKELESSVSTMDSKFLEELKNNKDKDKAGEILNTYKNDLMELKKEIDRLKNTSENRQSEKLSLECVEAIKSKNFELASKKLEELKDEGRIDWIVSKVYNGQKKNFNLINQFAKEISSPSKSLVFYKGLKKETDLSRHTELNHLLQFMEGIQKNVVSRIPDDDDITRIEADKILEDLKNEVKPLAIDLLVKSVHKRWLSREGDEMAEKITYDIGDYKFFREIAENVVKSVYPKRDFEQTLVTVESMRRVIPKLIWLKALSDQIAEDGLTVNTIDKLLLTQNAAEKAKENEDDDYMADATELWKSMQDVKISVIREFKKTLLQRFYTEKEVDDLSVKIFDYDRDVFESIIRAVVDSIYGKMSTVELLKQFRGSSRIGQSVTGYYAVFQRMKENGHLVINSQNVGALLKLNHVVTETLGMTNLKDIDPIFTTYLERIKKALPNLRGDVVAAIKTAVVEGNYTSEEHSNLSRNIFEVGDYGGIINTVVSDLFSHINTERILDYIRSQRNSSVRISGFFALQGKINANSDYLFEIAQSYRKIRDSDEYKWLSPSLKNQLEVYKFKLPSSIRNAAFGEEIYIKNLSRGGEYLFLASDNFNHDSKRRSVFTWIPGNRGNRSKWILEDTEEAGVYKLKNVGFDEYLFASESSFNFDKDRRKAFSWTSGSLGGEENKWRLIPTFGGVYIKNVHYKEYLFAGKHTRDSDRRFVFTWTPKGEIPDGKWAIEEFLTSY